VNGTEVPIKDLVGKGEFWVYAYDKEDQKIVPAKATARKTRDSAELVQVALDNGEVVKCTPDHPWMLRDGSYREAKDLKPGDSLMPLYRKVTCVTKLTESVQPVYDLAVDQYHNFALSAGVFVHNCMEPTFGSALQSLMFEPNDIQAVNQMKNAVRDAITKWDDRVEFVDFTVEPNGNELRCKVLYRFATDEIHNDILVSEFTLTQDMMTQR
jgi:phage baseplate assembly protein W